MRGDLRIDDRVSLTVGPKLRGNLVAMLEFIDAHHGRGHRIVVAHEGASQTLACSCGMPDGGRALVSAALVEEDVNDG